MWGRRDKRKTKSRQTRGGKKLLRNWAYPFSKKRRKKRKNRHSFSFSLAIFRRKKMPEVSSGPTVMGSSLSSSFFFLGPSLCLPGGHHRQTSCALLVKKVYLEQTNEKTDYVRPIKIVHFMIFCAPQCVVFSFYIYRGKGKANARGKKKSIYSIYVDGFILQGRSSRRCGVLSAGRVSTWSSLEQLRPVRFERAEIPRSQTPEQTRSPHASVSVQSSSK